MIPYVEPEKTVEGQIFWEGCKKNELLIPFCEDCDHYHFYPRALCPKCWSENIIHKKVSGQGLLYSYTTIYPKAPLAPYVVALIELEEGIRLMSNLLCEEGTDLTIGLLVTVTFVRIPESETVLPQFKLVEAIN